MFAGKQVFYLIDEAESAGKGANSVVSMVDHYLTHYGHGEEDGQFHFDNCSRTIASMSDKQNSGMKRVVAKSFTVSHVAQYSTRGETIYRLTVYRGTEASVRFTVQGGLETVRQRFASVFIWKKYFASIDIATFLFTNQLAPNSCVPSK